MAALPLCSVDWTVTDSRLVCTGEVTQVDGAQAELWINGGWDGDAFAEGFSGVVLLFIAGLGLGLVVSILRKTKV